MEKLYAKFMFPNSGSERDQKLVKKENLKVGERYLVKRVEMGGYYTSISLDGFELPFNSVHFEFEEENGTTVNIYRDSRYNPYM